MSEKYVINGREYDRLEDIPHNDRKLLEAKLRFFKDSDGDGTPDLFQDFGNAEISVTKRSRMQTEIIGKGKDRVIKHTTLDPDSSAHSHFTELFEKAARRKQKQPANTNPRRYFDKLVIAFLIVLVTLLVLDKFQLLP